MNQNMLKFWVNSENNWLSKNTYNHKNWVLRCLIKTLMNFELFKLDSNNKKIILYLQVFI